MEVVGGVASVIGIIQLADKVLSLCGKYASSVKSAKSDLERLVLQVRAVQSVLRDVESFARRQDPNQTTFKTLDERLAECTATLASLEAKLDLGGKRRSKLSFSLRQALRWPFQREEVDKDIRALEQHKASISIALQVALSETLGAIEQQRQLSEQRRLLSELPTAPGAAFNSQLLQHKPLCLPDTRTEVLEAIRNWVEDLHGHCIYWLKGAAGTGKSTISRTLAHELASKPTNHPRLGASFFFSRGQADLSHAGKLFTSIAVQLSHTLPVLGPYVSKATSENPDIAQRGLAEQWKFLIWQPLSKVKDLPESKLIIVLDALDECDHGEDVRLIIKLLADLSTLSVRVFITSRPDTPTSLGFNDIPDRHKKLILHDIPRSEVDRDISRFFRDELRKDVSLPKDWPCESDIERLCKRASGLFIYASTACGFILDTESDPEERLDLILKDTYIGESETWGLDKMYAQILEQSTKFGDDSGRTKSDAEQKTIEFRLITGSIVLLYNPLSAESLDKLLFLRKGTVYRRLRNLHSVLDVPYLEEQRSSIRLLHPSFRDFLLDNDRCTNPQFWVDKKGVHKTIFFSSLRLMTKYLKRDMCNLQLPGARSDQVSGAAVDDYIPLEVQYACRYWIHHLEEADVEHCDSDQIHVFLKSHFLYWFEALSLLRQMPDVIQLLEKLESIFSSRLDLQTQCTAYKSETWHDLLSFVTDGKRFLLKNRAIIEQAPLQIYSSALIFSPHESKIRSHFREQIPCWFNRFPEIFGDWGPALQVLEGHLSPIFSVAFSSSGILASGGFDCTVRLWDATKTGVLLATLEGHSKPVKTVVFSPDGKVLASGSEDNTVRLWDWNGVPLATLEGHSDIVKAVAFSPDGKVLASGSDDNTARLWDCNGVPLATLEGHSKSVTAIAFSPDGKVLASGSEDNTVRLWNLNGAWLATLQGHAGRVNAINFSPDGRFFASGSVDDTVRLWDLNGASQAISADREDEAKTVVFSPDRQLRSAISRDSTVNLWDPSASPPIATLEGHYWGASAIAFSPDGKLLASASGDGTVRLWNPSQTGASIATLTGHSDQVNALIFSPDGQLLASASKDNTIRLWNPSANASIATLDAHSECVTDIAFSLDSRLLASASNDSTVRLWDPSRASNTTTHPLDGRFRTITTLAFSPDGRILASGSKDKAVRLWDPSTNTRIATLKGHADWIRALSFSPDGQLLASGSDDSTVRLWDPLRAGALIATLTLHSDWILALTFSPNSQLLASGSDDRTVRLWDSSSGAIIATLRGHSEQILALAFSPDGQLLASGSRDGEIRLWELKGKKEIQKFCFPGSVKEISFVRDGTYLRTNQGILKLEPEGLREENQSQMEQLFLNTNIQSEWVSWGEREILWLPPEYRATSKALWDNTLAIGHDSGRTSYITIAPEKLPILASGKILTGTDCQSKINF